MKKVFLLIPFFCLSFLSTDLFAGELYEGGNLHNATALDWQVATKENKLATCADFVANMWTKKMLKYPIQIQIKTVDDMRPFAEKLVLNLDEAFRKDPDPVQNKNLYTNQSVSGTVAVLAFMLGWAK